MYEYEMDPTKTVGATERTRDAARDGRTDGRTEWNQYAPQQLRCAGGIFTNINLSDDCFVHVIDWLTAEGQNFGHAAENGKLSQHSPNKQTGKVRKGLNENLSVNVQASHIWPNVSPPWD